MAADGAFSEAASAFERGDLDLARTQAEQALSQEPAPRWHHLLGLIHCRQGNPQDGAPHLRAAADAEPANIGFKVMLARALVDAGHADEVLRMEKPALPPGAGDLALWHARAEAAGAIGRPAEAAEAWVVIAQYAGDRAEAWINLGRSLLALDRFREAEAAYRQALSRSPDSVDALFELGLIYDRTNRVDELDELLDVSLRTGVPKDQLSFLWAIRERRAGNFEAAWEHLLKSDADQDPVRWNRLRARIADKLGDPETAFAASLAVNRATPNFDDWRTRARAYREELRSLAETMTPVWASNLPVLEETEGRAPVFLVGFPRSGTTLLDTFLMGHPSITVVEEQEMLRRAAEAVGPLDQLPRIRAAMLEQVRRSYLDELGRYADRTAGLVVDKHPLNMLGAPLIRSLFPDAPIIFAQRHPCDAVLSGFMQSFTANLGTASFLDLQDSADFYDSALSLWSRAREVLALNVHTVVYEDLVRDPERRLRPVLQFLGLSWDDRIMDHRATATARGTIMNTSYDQVTEELNTGAIGRWRRYQEQLRPVLPVLLPWAERLGYER